MNLKVINDFLPKGEREFQITFRHKKLLPNESPNTLCYNWDTGAIELPNYGKKIDIYIDDKLIDSLVDNLTHEIMHKDLHENVNGLTCDKWDNIDKIPDTKVYRLSSLGRYENCRELKLPNFILIE